MDEVNPFLVVLLIACFTLQSAISTAAVIREIRRGR